MGADHLAHAWAHRPAHSTVERDQKGLEVMQ
jgi:hypothetical protein